MNYPSETSKCRHLTAPYCQGCGVDIASQGDPVVPWAMSFDLPMDEFLYYNSGNRPQSPIQLSGHADKLPFNSDSLDFCYSSHLLEDFLDWMPILKEWTRVIKPGGNLIVLIPDKEIWGQAIKNGQPPNCAHKHEGQVGELTSYAPELGLEVIEDRLTNCPEGDYGIMFIARKLGKQNGS